MHVPPPDELPSEEQEKRWQEAIAGLMETCVFLPPLEPIPPCYTMGRRQRVWRVRLTDGRMGWARERPQFGGDGITYYLPQDVVKLCEVKYLIGSGYTREQARRELRSAAHACPAETLKWLLELSEHRYVELKAEVAAIKVAEQAP